MKLVKRRLERLEAEGKQREELGDRLASATARAAAASEAAGIVWTADEQKLSRPLLAGEHVAYDLLVMDLDGSVVTGTHERASTDPEDLGNVYDEAGRLVGRVWMAENAQFIWWEPVDEDDGRALL